MATKKNYIDSGVSDSDLISLAGNLQASQLAVPEKTTWDFIQEDIEEWQGKVQARAAKFMQDLPEDFDLNKVEPEGREAIGKWYKSMRKDFMKAANKASLFDPGSFAYGEGTNSMNKIEDNLGSINGIFENIKTVRTKAIKDKDKLASQVTGDNKALLNAIISGEMFENMEIKDGDITFKVDGYMEKDKESENFGQPKIFTSEDIQNGALKLYDSERNLEKQKPRSWKEVNNVFSSRNQIQSNEKRINESNSLIKLVCCSLEKYKYHGVSSRVGYLSTLGIWNRELYNANR